MGNKKEQPGLSFIVSFLVHQHKGSIYQQKVSTQGCAVVLVAVDVTAAVVVMARQESVSVSS